MLTLQSLRAAWRRVHENQGGPGSDGVSLRRFERLLDANLLELADAVQTGAYRPGRVRRTVILSGQKVRTITVQPVRDRVLQRAALDLLTPSAERLFLPTSYGYRPGRSVQDAAEHIVTLHARGLEWVIDADIRDCFGSIDLSLLIEATDAFVADPLLRALIRMWVAPDGKLDDERGIELGAVISPLLCNLFLHRLDVGLARRRYVSVRYADDFVVLCRSEEHAERALRAATELLRGMRLELHPAKTRLTTFRDGFTFLGVAFEGDEWTFVTEGKRVTARGRLPDNWYYGPDDYAAPPPW